MLAREGGSGGVTRSVSRKLVLRIQNNNHENTRSKGGKEKKKASIKAGWEIKLGSTVFSLLQCLRGRAKSLSGRLHQNAHFITRGPGLPL